MRDEVSVAAPPTLRNLTRVRALKSEDLPEIARIFLNVFRNSSESGSKRLQRDLRSAFLEHPHFDESTCALVYERNDGELAGFLGSLPLRMILKGKRQLGSAVSTWMVPNRSRDPNAGALLIQTHMKRGHSFTLADTANNTSLGFSRAIKMRVLHANSLQWVKPLSYAGYTLGMFDRGKSKPWLRGLSIGASRAEGYIRRLAARSSDPYLGNFDSREVDAETFSESFVSLLSAYPLQPDWTPEFVQWAVAECSRRPSMGRLLLCEVRDGHGQTVGCFALHITPAHRAIVVQVLAKRYSERAVLHALIEHARLYQSIAVYGAASPRLLEGLFCLPNVFYRHTCATAVKAVQPDFLQAFIEGEALTGGFVGDAYLPFTTESYDDEQIS